VCVCVCVSVSVYLSVCTLWYVCEPGSLYVVYLLCEKEHQLCRQQPTWNPFEHYATWV